jgi:outer membrane protein assembly factor BamB
VRRLAAVLVVLLIASGCGGSSTWRIAAIDPATGATKWFQSTRVGLLDSPKFTSGDNAMIVVDDSDLMALDPASGERLWTRKGDITVADGLALALDDGEIVARDLGDGHEMWRRPSPVAGDGVTVGAAAIGIVIVEKREGGPVAAMSARNGSELWSQADMDQPVGTIGSDGLVVAGATGIQVRDVRTGDLRWSSPVSPIAMLGWLLGSPPLIDAGDVLGVPIDSGRSNVNQMRLQFHDITTGDIRWEVDVASRPIGDASDDVVVVYTPQSTVEARTADDGTMLWSKPISGVEGLAAIDGAIVVLRTGGRLVAYDADGLVRWERRVTPGQDLHTAGDTLVLVG